jgi:GT2 family glycosyltransferase
MTITAIVPVWNGRELLERLLITLDAQTLPATEVLIVDNGSTDGAPELARSRSARVISMGRNAGFSAAVNRGIRESRSDWIAVLNSDVELAPDYFEQLIATGSWFATGKILTARSKDCAKVIVDGTFDAVCRGGTAWRVGSGRPDSTIFSTRRRIWSPPWTAALFRSELFSRVGLLEESFESYVEDVDFGLRCAAYGIEGIYQPAAVAWHHGSATLGRWHPETVRRIARNQIFLLARHYPPELLARWRWCILVAHLLWGSLAVRHGASLAWLRGSYQGLRGFSAVRAACNPIESRVLGSALRNNERTIREVQASSGFDLYWRLYFLLTGGGE